MNTILIISLIILGIICILLRDLFYHLFIIILVLINKKYAAKLLFNKYDKKLIAYKKTLKYSKINKKYLIFRFGKEGYDKRVTVLKSNIKFLSDAQKKILKIIPWK